MMSCKSSLNNQYNMENINLFLYEDNKERYSNAYSKNLFLPSVDKVVDAKGVTVDTYLLFSENADNSTIYKYKNVFTKRSIASLTKIITLLTVLKECDDLSRKVTVSANATNLGVHSSMAGLKRGDEISIEDLLYGLMLPSGNDCAIVLAENVANSVDDFVLLMNRLAENIGAVHSHFTNPHGLDDTYHYSTAFDIYLFMREGSKYELFNKIIGTSKYNATVVSETGESRNIEWTQTNKYLNGEKQTKENVSVIGGKTGSTNNAGRCLSIFAKQNSSGETFYAIVLNSANDTAVYRNMDNLLATLY